MRDCDRGEEKETPVIAGVVNKDPRWMKKCDSAKENGTLAPPTGELKKGIDEKM